MNTLHKKILKLVNKHSYSQIAKLLGCHKSAVGYHVKQTRRGLKVKDGVRYNWTNIKSYYDSGHSLYRCMEKFGFHKMSWQKAVARGDIIPRPAKTPLSELLVNGRRCNSVHLKKRLIEECILENKCYECGQGPTWNDKPLVLQLDHINGIKTDNRLKNLRILCPHCHTQTPTYGSKSPAFKK